MHRSITTPDGWDHRTTYSEATVAEYWPRIRAALGDGWQQIWRDGCVEIRRDVEGDWPSMEHVAAISFDALQDLSRAARTRCIDLEAVQIVGYYPDDSETQARIILRALGSL